MIWMSDEWEEVGEVARGGGLGLGLGLGSGLMVVKRTGEEEDGIK